MKASTLACLCLTLFVPLAFSQTNVLQSGLAAPQPRTASRKDLGHLKANLQSPYGPEQVLYAFQGSPDGQDPRGGLIFDSKGNLYGTTQNGGNVACSGGCGTVFELSPSGSGGWTETILYNFQGGNDGEYPDSGLIFDQAGNLYGTTGTGGSGAGAGTVFELTPQAGRAWTKTILYSFQGDTDAFGPQGVIFDASGTNLFGTTESEEQEGGSCVGTGCGTVFELSPNGSGGWTEAILYTFQSNTSNGWGPDPGLIFDGAGNLYGATGSGGGTNCGTGFTVGCGTVFELRPNGSGGWTETILHSFGLSSETDGQAPNGGLIFDKSGNLYGTTDLGGTGSCTELGYSGCGTVYELSPNGSGGWKESILYNFQNGDDGSEPAAGLTFDQSGNLYGATGLGGGATACGSNGCGTVFELSPNGNGTWVESVLYSFQGGSDGAGPDSTLILDSTGNLYGTSGGGGTGCGGSGCGTVFEVSKESFATFSPLSFNFGNQTTGATSSPQVITLTDTGSQPLTISLIQITGTNFSEFGQTNNCPASLTPSSSCSITVTFSPTALGSASASVSVTDNAPGSPQSAPLSGTGVAPNVPLVTLSPSSVTFPSQYVGTSGLPQTVTLKNTGDRTLTITNVTTSPSDFAPLSSCGSSVQPGQSCSIGVFFDPTTGGVRDGVLTVTDNASTSPQTVPLSGNGEDFSLASSSSSTATVMPGQTASYSVSVGPLGGFNQAVSISCSGAPAGATCTVSPSSVTLNGSALQEVTVTVATTASSARMMRPRNRSFEYALWLACSGLLGLPIILLKPYRGRKSRSQWLAMLGLICVLAVVSGLPACGGGSSSSGGGGVQAGSYSLTITGSFASGKTSLSHNTKLTLLVQ